MRVLVQAPASKGSQMWSDGIQSHPSSSCLVLRREAFVCVARGTKLSPSFRAPLATGIGCSLVNGRASLLPTPCTEQRPQWGWGPHGAEHCTLLAPAHIRLSQEDSVIWFQET